MKDILIAEDWNQVMKENKAVICCSANWCIPCKSFKAVYEEIEKKFMNEKFYRVDVDDFADEVIDFGVKSVPTILIICQGKLVASVAGVDREKVEDMILKN